MQCTLWTSTFPLSLLPLSFFSPLPFSPIFVIFKKRGESEWKGNPPPPPVLFFPPPPFSPFPSPPSFFPPFQNTKKVMAVVGRPSMPAQNPSSSPPLLSPPPFFPPLSSLEDKMMQKPILYSRLVVPPPFSSPPPLSFPPPFFLLF